MYTVHGGALNGVTFQRLYNALEAIKKAQGWSEVWTSDPITDADRSRLYVYESEVADQSDTDQSGPYVAYQAE